MYSYKTEKYVIWSKIACHCDVDKKSMHVLYIMISFAKYLVRNEKLNYDYIQLHMYTYCMCVYIICPKAETFEYKPSFCVSFGQSGRFLGRELPLPTRMREKFPSDFPLGIRDATG